MECGWGKVTISQVASIYIGGTPSRSVPEYWGGEIKWASARDVANCASRYIRDTQESISTLGLRNSAAKVLDKDTTLITARGTVGAICMLAESMAFNQTCYGLVAKQNTDPTYLYYALKASLSEIATISYGTVFNTITMSSFDVLKIPHPPLAEQRAIAHILGTLDDKIELNRQMNQTLEAMAQALFKSWFVDFEPVCAKAQGRDSGLPKHIDALFPESFEESDLGDIPAGWEIVSIEDLSKRVAMGPFGSSIKVSTFVQSGIPVISGQHLNHTMLEDNDYNFVSPEHAERLRNSNIFRGDIVFTHAGNIGQVAYIPDTSRYERYVISQRQFYMRCDLAKTSPLFIVYYFKSPEGQHMLLANTSSTGVPSIAQPVSYLKTIKLRVPTKPLIDEFDKLIHALHSRMSKNSEESKTLADIRDTLLPKLLSGEIRVKDTEKFIKEGIT